MTQSNSATDFLYDYIQNEYEINKAGDIESALLDKNFYYSLSKHLLVFSK